MGSTPIAETILKTDCTEKSTTQKGENMKKIERDDELSIIKYLHTATFDSVCASADFDATVACICRRQRQCIKKTKQTFCGSCYSKIRS